MAEYGSTRIVFLTRSWAIKVPYYLVWRNFLLGLLANMEERQLHDVYWGEEYESFDRLCPVKFSLWGGWLLVMPRCEPLTREEFEEWKAHCDYQNMPLEVEPKLSSWGWLEGRVVAIDYGN